MYTNEINVIKHVHWAVQIQNSNCTSTSFLNYEYDKSLRAIGLNPNWKKESGFSMSLSLAFWYFLYSLQIDPYNKYYKYKCHYAHSGVSNDFEMNIVVMVIAHLYEQ